jgi:hypothetical protein
MTQTRWSETVKIIQQWGTDDEPNVAFWKSFRNRKEISCHNVNTS